MASKYDKLDLSSRPSRTKGDLPDFRLTPVTSKDDATNLAIVDDRAFDADPTFKQWMAMFTERTNYDTTLDAVAKAIDDPENLLVKAVIADPGSDNGEKIVGFIHWFCGWIVLDKVDPFAKEPKSPTQEVTDVNDVTSNVAEELASEAAKLEEPSRFDQESAIRVRRLKKGEQKYVETRNHYIAAIRGKRHMFVRRIMVLPEYQGTGVGTRLMRVVTDEADRLKIPCWLFARPVGVSLYKKLGYRSVGITVMTDAEEEYESADTLSMIRASQPVSS